MIRSAKSAGANLLKCAKVDLKINRCTHQTLPRCCSNTLLLPVAGFSEFPKQDSSYDTGVELNGWCHACHMECNVSYDSGQVRWLHISGCTPNSISTILLLDFFQCSRCGGDFVEFQLTQIRQMREEGSSKSAPIMMNLSDQNFEGTGEVHHDIICEICEQVCNNCRFALQCQLLSSDGVITRQYPITGGRFKCRDCASFDICEGCYNNLIVEM
jgi:hypothetical protein